MADPHLDPQARSQRAVSSGRLWEAQWRSRHGSLGRCGADTTMHINKPVSSLVQHGPFRYSRNPGYLFLTMLYAGIAVLKNALWAILPLPLVLYVIQREVIEREERYLERTFGEEYLAYKARVRRWV